MFDHLNIRSIKAKIESMANMTFDL